ncbi:CLUMA_CG018105, isoform A [Clunio marinus]|uniref:CLUMA_CG018105, isoform A n=1 Tax=Clunio marinus TaxID=568069 RepID=A0A1J1IZ02_9DIPT|nr:CLUMA_CG018105, isoform A [Clunio marinus]
MEHHEGKLKSITLQEKLKLIEIVESGMSVKDVAEEHSVNRNTLHYILKHREKIRNSLINKPSISRFKRIKQTKSPELEKRILEFMYESRAKNEKLSGSIIKTIALTIASELGVENFHASNGWLFSFFKRNNISMNSFNQGVELNPNPVEPKEKSKSKTSAKDFIIEEIPMKEENQEIDIIIEDHVIDEITSQENLEVDMNEIESIDYAFSEEEHNVEESSDITPAKFESEASEDVPWRSWCRLCGFYESTEHLEIHQIDLVQQLFHISVDDIRVCDECLSTINNISKLYHNSRVVENMLLEFEERNKACTLTKNEISKIRQDFGFDDQNYDEIERDSEIHESDSIDETCEENYENVEVLSVTEENYFKSDDQDEEEIGFEEIVDSVEISELPNEEKEKTIENAVVEDDYIYKCHICDEIFERMCFLSNHTRTVHQTTPKVECSCGHDEKYSFKCDICDKRVVNKWSLKYHIETIHENAKKHFCHLCGRGFGNKSNLRSHVISHSTENVICSTCGGKFKNRISLQSHKKIHKPENLRNFACMKCNKTFHNRHHLQRHMVSHTEERSFKCPYSDCRNEYKWQKDLKNHLTSVHLSERPYNCHFCERNFVDNVSVRKHRLKEHPKELADFELKYGKGRRIDAIFSENFDMTYDNETEIVE